MPADSGVILPEIGEELEDSTGLGGPSIVILYNCDCHSMEEVVEALIAATGHSLDRCVAIMAEAHIQGRAVAYSGSVEECERAAGVLRRAGLQVETDRAQR